MQLLCLNCILLHPAQTVLVLAANRQGLADCQGASPNYGNTPPNFALVRGHLEALNKAKLLIRCLFPFLAQRLLNPYQYCHVHSE